MLVIDIETVPSQHATEHPDLYASRRWEGVDKEEWFGLHPASGQVVCICMMDTDQPKEFLKFFGHNETKILVEFWEFMAKYAHEKRGVKLISFSGKTFDVPFLEIRSALLGVQIPIELPHRKFDQVYHFDCYEVLYPFTASLDLMTVAIKGEGKSKLPSSVYQSWLANDLDAIVDYCQKDVIATYNLWRRLRNIPHA